MKFSKDVLETSQIYQIFEFLENCNFCFYYSLQQFVMDIIDITITSVQWQCHRLVSCLKIIESPKTGWLFLINDLFSAIKPLIAVNKRVWSKLSWNSRQQKERRKWGGICCISRDFILRKTTCSPSRCSLGRFATALASVCKTTVLLPFCLRYPEKKKK